ncbi:MAG: RNA-directed DNA polymerase [Candidatus Sedimenticola sp. (ex Thyasira tokunagai)]
MAKNISDNWGDISSISENENSIIKPHQHVDGRMIVMNYEDVTEKVQRSLADGFGKRFRVHTDIASCFHSIYTHSIPWAVIGFEEVKKKLADGGGRHWSDDLDKYLRKSKRNETQGVAIGPGTSSSVVELILGAVDKRLKDSGYIFRRYIDDYVCYCINHEQAQKFIQQLGRELAVYKLNINLHKTKIIEMPEPSNPEWVSELSSALPVGFVDSESNQRKLTLIEMIHYLDTAVTLNKVTPDGSVIKYAVGAILRYADTYAVCGVLDYVTTVR